MGERVRHSPLLVSGKGRDPCRQHGNGRRNAGKSCFLQKCPGGEKKKKEIWARFCAMPWHCGALVDAGIL